MKFYILEGNLKENVPMGPEFQKVLDAHHAYMVPFFRESKVLASGPKTGGRGGVILLRLEDDERIEDFCAGDPFAQSGLQEYRVCRCPHVRVN